MLPEEKENTVSFVCSLWESVFKISVMWGWIYSGNYPSEEKQNKSLSKLRQNLLVPQIYSGQPLIGLSECSFTLYLTYLTLYLLRYISVFTSKDRFGDLWKRCEDSMACNRKVLCVFQKELIWKWPLKDAKFWWSDMVPAINVWLGRLHS